MTLSVEEIERYARHIVLADVGGEGQQKLKAAKVLVVGAGGLGAPLLQYLAAAGVGTIGVVDDDTVAISNLQRQVIHDTANIGLSKTDSARTSIERINPHVTVVAHKVRLVDGNAEKIIKQYDLVADGSDNFDTRYLVAAICEKLSRTLVTAAVGRFDGSITTLKPFASDKSGNRYPRYIDIFPVKPKAGLLPSCAEAGILGALTGVLGTMQAMEIIKEITGVGEGLAGRLILFDSKAMRFETVKYKRRQD